MFLFVIKTIKTFFKNVTRSRMINVSKSIPMFFFKIVRTRIIIKNHYKVSKVTCLLSALLQKQCRRKDPYEQRSVAAALRQFTFLVAQRLVVDKAALVSRSSTHNKKPHCKNAADLCGDKSSLKQRCKSLLKRCDKDIRTVLSWPCFEIYVAVFFWFFLKVAPVQNF